jgi:hypothetical protein
LGEKNMMTRPIDKKTKQKKNNEQGNKIQKVQIEPRREKGKRWGSKTRNKSKTKREEENKQTQPRHKVSSGGKGRRKEEREQRSASTSLMITEAQGHTTLATVTHFCHARV